MGCTRYLLNKVYISYYAWARAEGLVIFPCGRSDLPFLVYLCTIPYRTQGKVR